MAAPDPRHSLPEMDAAAPAPGQPWAGPPADEVLAARAAKKAKKVERIQRCLAKPPPLPPPFPPTPDPAADRALAKELAEMDAWTKANTGNDGGKARDCKVERVNKRCTVASEGIAVSSGAAAAAEESEGSRATQHGPTVTADAGICGRFKERKGLTCVMFLRDRELATRLAAAVASLSEVRDGRLLPLPAASYHVTLWPLDGLRCDPRRRNIPVWRTLQHALRAHPDGGAGSARQRRPQRRRCRR